MFIFGFVAVPLPLTGVWTGTCVAVAIGLKYWQVVLSCILGNMVAGLIIMTVCAVFPQITTILFVIFLVIILLMIVYSLIKHFVSKISKSKESSQSQMQSDKKSQNNQNIVKTNENSNSQSAGQVNIIINGNNINKK